MLDAEPRTYTGEYECLHCREIVAGTSKPDECPACGTDGPFRHVGSTYENSCEDLCGWKANRW